jgi:hypothetical protein
MDERFILAGLLILIMVAGVLVLYVIASHMRDLHLTMNSRLDELVRVTKALARAEGFAAGKENHLNAIRKAGDATDHG